MTLVWDPEFGVISIEELTKLHQQKNLYPAILKQTLPGRIAADKWKKEHPEEASEIGKKAVKAREQMRKKDPKFDAYLKDASRRGGRKGGKVTAQRRKNDPKLDARLREAAGRGGKTGAAGRALAKRRKEDRIYDELMREYNRLGGEAAQRALAGNRVLDTWIEKRVQFILEKIGLIRNKDFKIKPYIKTNPTFRFPDALIVKDNLNLAIECDEEHWHQDKAKERKRDKELVNVGLKVLHLSAKVIRNYYPLKQLIIRLLKEAKQNKWKVKYIYFKGEICRTRRK